MEVFDIHTSPTPEKITSSLRHVRSEEQLHEDADAATTSAAAAAAAAAANGNGAAAGAAGAAAPQLHESASMFSLVNAAAMNNGKLHRLRFLLYCEFCGKSLRFFLFIAAQTTWTTAGAPGTTTTFSRCSSTTSQVRFIMRQSSSRQKNTYLIKNIYFFAGLNRARNRDRDTISQMSMDSTDSR